MWMCQPDNPPNIKLDTESFNLFKSGGPSVMIDGAVVNKTFGHGLLSPQVLQKDFKRLLASCSHLMQL